MSRASAAAERVVVFLAGVAVIVLGAAAVAWQQDRLPGAADAIAVPDLVAWTDEAWWPWTVGAAGIALALVALLWMSAHAHRRTVGRLRLSGSGRDGRLVADVAALSDAVGAPFAAVPGAAVRQTRLHREQGETVLDLRVAVDPATDLDAVVTAAELAAAVARRQLGDDTDVRFRTVVVAGRRRGRPAARVI
ncbi:Asp23/Gls24 family envelope stress response protein [Jiangella alkaliphila]|uniref:Alkaline shock response membrane anchor protein AmaP n=1 Tax=Jiangella alkaliphila TaxID=419479 RepID=A0A1H2L706_9ACTN|nr:hypothetical protein [Jiangella alkaliphila]SDU76847.1 hypothetical protein SAMN04488563_5336 [Jiangella alkaliphila]